MNDPTESPRTLEDHRVERARRALAEYDATSIGEMAEADLLNWLGRFAVVIENLLSFADQLRAGLAREQERCNEIGSWLDGVQEKRNQLLAEVNALHAEVRALRGEAR